MRTSSLSKQAIVGGHQHTREARAACKIEEEANQQAEACMLGEESDAIDIRSKVVVARAHKQKQINPKQIIKPIQ